MEAQPLPRAFFARPAHVVAPELLGCRLVRPDQGLAVEILEVEAYEEHEPASHSHRGPTPRNTVMFGPAGHLYTYFTYGMHWCANVVTGEEGQGQGVLLRAAVPIEGIEVMRARRGPVADGRDLLRGPARLAKALGLGRAEGGTDLVQGPEGMHLLAPAYAPVVAVGPRVGVRLAADLPWRMWVADHPLVSTYRRHPKAAAPTNAIVAAPGTGDAGPAQAG